MKNILVACMIVFVSCACAFAGDKEPQYQVNISIQFNSENFSSAAEIQKEVAAILTKRPACSYSIKLSKPEEEMLIWNASNTFVTLESDGTVRTRP